MRSRTFSPHARIPRLLLAVLPIAAALGLPRSAAIGQHAAADDVGVVDFKVSCAAHVQADFDRAVALLHHMMYEESRKVFSSITQQDPQCGMAHWGIAMTLFYPLWPARPGRDALKRGWEEVGRAKAALPDSKRDRALIDAADAFFRDPEGSDYWLRIRRWADAMAAARRAHPDDIETAAFYALSQIAVGQLATDRIAHNARAARVLLSIHQREPRHPGAIHYTIHANDVTGRASEAPEIVGSYSQIAPDVPHALHMPTHIFVRLGQWPEVIEWNRRSTEAALRVAPADTALCAHYPHAPAYLLYAHLQRGEDGQAAAVLADVRDVLRNKTQFQGEFVCAFHLAAMPARLALERRAWPEAAALVPRSPQSLAWDHYPWAEAITWLARGLGAVHSGDLAGARAAEARMAGLRARAEALGEQNWARYIEIDRRILAGWLAHAEGNADRAVELLQAAAELEKTVQKSPVTPGALVPAYEALGDLLFELNRPARALEAYEASLREWPARYRSLLGAARASQATGKHAEARRFYTELLSVVDVAQTNRPGVREARAALARQ